jgi:hypothetical protein
VPGPPTPNLGLAVPTIGGDNNIWGAELNGDLAILDTLAICAIIATSVNLTLPLVNAVETVVRVTTGAGVVSVIMPSPNVAGKIYTIKKIDAGVGSVSVVPSTGLIDGQASWVRATQYSYVRILANGSSYDVIGNN